MYPKIVIEGGERIVSMAIRRAAAGAIRHQRKLESKEIVDSRKNELDNK